MKRIAAIFVLAISLSGCASLGLNIDRSHHETAGVMLTEVHGTVKAFCDIGIINGTDCERLKAAYNRARAAYFITGGDIKNVPEWK